MGAGYNTRVVAQARTLGNVPDLSSVSLTYDDGSPVSVSPDYIVQEEVTSGGFAGLVSTFGWDIAGLNPGSLLFELNAAGSSMSLANLAVDTYTQTGAFGAFPAVIPEPSSIAITALAGCGLLIAGLRRRFDQDASLS